MKKFILIFGLTCGFFVINTKQGIAKEFKCPEQITTKVEEAELTFYGDLLVLKSAVYKEAKKELKCLYHPSGLERVFVLHATLPRNFKECKFENAEKSKEKECLTPPCVLNCEE